MTIGWAGTATCGGSWWTVGRTAAVPPRPLVGLPLWRPWPRPRLLPRPLDVAAVAAAVAAAASFASFSAVSKQHVD